MEAHVMPSQDLLFHETFEDALAEVMSRCGGRKSFAQEMSSAKPPREAHNHVDACLNPERREKFSPAEVLYIARKGREVGCHAVMRYLCQELGYADPQPIEPRDELAELQRAWIQSVQVQQKLADRMERLQPQLRAA
jgi:hypothetical protein